MEQALATAGVQLFGHIVNTREVMAPPDMLLQPMLYASMRDYHGVLDVCIVSGSAALMDIAVPLALCFVEQAVFAWVPSSYITEPSPARQHSINACNAQCRGVWSCLGLQSCMAMFVCVKGCTWLVDATAPEYLFIGRVHVHTCGRAGAGSTCRPCMNSITLQHATACL